MCDKFVTHHGVSVNLTDLFCSEVERISSETDVSFDSSKYLVGFEACWKCCSRILVFSWPSYSLPPDPRPKTVRWIRSYKRGHAAYFNTCPYCGMLQGDWYLYSEPDGPFFGSPSMQRQVIDYWGYLNFGIQL